MRRRIRPKVEASRIEPRTRFRISYENMVGPIPAGLTIDHLAR